MEGYTKITDIRPFDFCDEDAVRREIEAFCRNYSNADIEHALVISPSGQIFELAGLSGKLNIELVGKDALRGSRVIHKHSPKDKDSFSLDDFEEYFGKGLFQLEVVCEDLHCKMRYEGEPITLSRAYELYNEARLIIWQIAKDSRMFVKMEQLEIMRQLSKTMKGLVFDE